MFMGWRNVADHFKQQRIKDQHMQLTLSDMNKRYAIQKWYSRMQATKMARLRVQRLKEKFERIRKMMVFNGIRQIFNNSKNFMTRMSNLANIHDH